MDITSSDWLQIIGFIIFISGIGIIIYSKKSTIKTVFHSEDKDIVASWLGPVGWISSYPFDINLRIKFISNDKKPINYKIIGSPTRRALGATPSGGYKIDKIGFNGNILLLL